jgi:putative heme transporter
MRADGSEGSAFSGDAASSAVALGPPAPDPTTAQDSTSAPASAPPPATSAPAAARAQDEPTPRRTARRAVRRAWPVVRIVVGFALVGIAVWVLSSKGSELSEFADVVKTLNWWWVPPAFAVEILSYVLFARMQYELFKAAHLIPPWSPLVKLSFASQALTNSLPVGNALASVYGFRWFRRFGADNTLAIWALAGTLVASIVSLSLVAVIGLGLATNEGASLDLVPVLIGVFAFALALGSLFVYERPLHAAVTTALRVSVAVTGRPRGDTAQQIASIMAWMTAVRLRWSQIGRIVGWGTLNWLADCACFAMMFLAIHAPIPWKGLLLAYGAGQLAANLPVTPGGLGVVEGSITIALVAFGGSEATTPYAVLLYRIISFWFVLAVGWLFIGQLALQVRRGRWQRQAMESDVEAGPVAYEPAPPMAESPAPARTVPARTSGPIGATGEEGQP